MKSKKLKKVKKRVKIAILGDKSVGKTAIFNNIKKITMLRGLTHSMAYETYNHIIKYKKCKLQMQIWDTISEE